MQAPAAKATRAWEGMQWLRGEERTNYPFTLSVDDLGEGFGLTAQTVASVNPRRVCEFMRTALEAVVGALEKEPRRAVQSLQVLPAAERHQLLYEWNATEVAYPKDKCIPELFEEQVAKSPEAIAVVFEEASLSYAELNRRANQLGYHLEPLGVRPDVRVAIILERSIELVVAELAILKCGAGYVPIDPTFPGERKVFMVEDSEASIVLSVEKMDLPEMIAVTRINLDKNRATEGTGDSPDLYVKSDAVAYIMYTSGSSGQPKGVLVPHQAIIRLVRNNGYAQFEANDRVAFAANPAFDASTLEVWAPLLNGGRIVLIDKAVLLDPIRFGGALRRHSVNVLWRTVGLFNQYADVLAEDFASLRYLIIGGDALNPQIIARLLHASPPEHVINGYGPTETTTFAITYEINVVPENAHSIPIGH